MYVFFTVLDQIPFKSLALLGWFSLEFIYKDNWKVRKLFKGYQIPGSEENFCRNFDFWLIVKVLVWSLWNRKKKMRKSKFWRRNDGFSFLQEVKITVLIGSHMVFFAGISTAGWWIIRNVSLIVSDSMQSSFVFFMFFCPWASSKSPTKRRTKEIECQWKRPQDRRKYIKEATERNRHWTVTTNEKELFDHSS